MLDELSIRELLKRVAQREASVEEALAELRVLPFEDLGFAKVDHHRDLRRGFPEVIYCQGKTPEQVAQIAARLAAHAPRILGSRASPEHYTAAKVLIPELQFDGTARCLWLDREPDRPRKP